MSCDCEMPTVYSESHPRSRKRRHCCECNGFIEISETYHRISGCWEGSFSDYTTCDQYTTLRHDLDKIIDCCVGLGSLADELHELRSERWDEAPALVARFTDIRIRRGAAICPLFHAEENELPSP